MTTAILLEDRGIIEIAGEEASKFLQNLVTNDVASLKPGEARFAALLTPQGKILFDFLVFAAGTDR
ncbi:MAG: folate-binding protein, partial [Alphaproteobacteria bacterium]|nr:folate-binding protein [Alphaproteobacteria bacterium]